MVPRLQFELPDEVVEYVRAVFLECNNRVSRKMSRMPTTHETSLDLSFIEAISQFGAPHRFQSDWVVRLETHYLGGGRHFGEWEVADIGFIVVFRREGAVRLRKIALLQSKRLYPDEQELEEDVAIDYMIGFGRLMQSDDEGLAAMDERSFGFQVSSRYKALHVGDEQYRAIEEYEKRHSIPVHYLLYHPLSVPWTQVIPVRAGENRELPQCDVGARVLRARDLRDSMAGRGAGYSPSYADLSPPGRWRVEAFVADELLRCREGYVAGGPQDSGLSQVFNRRTGPIAAAIAITIDQT